jgi:F-type H+-transporting ATPase subunit delta
MAELATIARPYAEALFQATKNDLQATAAWLDELAAIASNAQLLQFASNPKATTEQIMGVVKGVAKSQLSAAADNFLRTVVDNGRLSALPEMAAQYREHVNAQSGSSDAVVYSAFEIAPAALADVTALLQKRFGRTLHVKVEIEPELIGGIRVVVGDEVLDTSVKARLDQMKVALTA